MKKHSTRKPRKPEGERSPLRILVDVHHNLRVARTLMDDAAYMSAAELLGETVDLLKEVYRIREASLKELERKERTNR